MVYQNDDRYIHNHRPVTDLRQLHCPHGGIPAAGKN